MFLGLLVGLALFGAVIILCNGSSPYDSPQLKYRASIMRIIGFAAFIIASCGAIGLWIEVYFK